MFRCILGSNGITSHVANRKPGNYVKVALASITVLAVVAILAAVGTHYAHASHASHSTSLLSKQATSLSHAKHLSAKPVTTTQATPTKGHKTPVLLTIGGSIGFFFLIIALATCALGTRN